MTTIFDMQKQMMGEFEKNMTTWFDGILRDPTWLKLMSSQVTASLDFQEQVRKAMEPGFRASGILTETSQSGLYETLANLQRRVMDLEARLEEAELKAQTPKKDDKSRRENKEKA